MGGKNILFISAWPISPATAGGQVRSLGFAQALVRLGHTVRIHTFGGRQEDYRRARGCIELQLAPGLSQYTDLNLFHGLLQTTFRRLGAPPFWQYVLMRRGWVARELERAIDAADVVFSNMPHSAPLPGRFSRKPWIMLSHNVEWRLMEQGPWRERRWAGWMRRIESSAPARFADIVAVTTEDQQFYRDHDASHRQHVPIVGCGVDAAVYLPQPEERLRIRAQHGIADDERVVIFTGSRFAPNLQAVEAICRYADRRADWLAERRIRILLVGSVVDVPFSRGAVLGVGRVPQIVPYLSAADAGLNPVSSGSGANVKMFEYLAMRLPIIATTFGARGTDLVPHVDYLPCEPDDLTAALQALCERDPAVWRAFGEEVWTRHRQHCDMVEAVRAALAELDAFR